VKYLHLSNIAICNAFKISLAYRNLNSKSKYQDSYKLTKTFIGTYMTKSHAICQENWGLSMTINYITYDDKCRT
jgi:hypothetical protein